MYTSNGRCALHNATCTVWIKYETQLCKWTQGRVTKTNLATGKWHCVNVTAVCHHNTSVASTVSRALCRVCDSCIDATLKHTIDTCFQTISCFLNKHFFRSENWESYNITIKLLIVIILFLFHRWDNEQWRKHYWYIS